MAGQFRTDEILTTLAMSGQPFNTDDWELDLCSCYYEHKTKKIRDEDGEHPLRISKKRLIEMGHM